MSKAYKVQFHCSGAAGSKNYRNVVQMLRKTIEENKLAIEVTEVNYEELNSAKEIIKVLEDALRYIVATIEQQDPAQSMGEDIGKKALESLKEYREWK